MTAKLTAKQQKFIDEYLQCFNATEAARRAGYKSTNGSLRAIGCENLTKPYIRETIKQHFQASAMTADEALSRLAAIARSDGEDIKPSDALRALELIGKYYAMFTDRVEQEVKVSSKLVILPPNDK